jgi:cob(I)alamin adenosyltransferase
MVRITKIYTRTGDDGSTGLGSGTRVQKSDQRVEAYGSVDEANAAIGVAIEACRTADADPDSTLRRTLADVLRTVQHDLFDLGADLCVPGQPDEVCKDLRILASQTQRLESQIDDFNANLPPLTSFILPGGSTVAASLHLARTITRRAEREVVRLIHDEPDRTSVETVHYLNRLSDLLFVMARVANRGNDVLWKPGANREDQNRDER